MPTPLFYKIMVAVLIAGIVGASGTAAYLYQNQNVKILQTSDLNNQVNQLEGQITALNAQIGSLNVQINSLNSQITQLQTLNSQLGGNNAQLISQMQQLNTQNTQLTNQVSQLQTQISQLQSQVDNLRSIISSQKSRVIANTACIYADCPNSNGGNQVGNQNFIDLGSIPYSGYLRVSWTGGHVSFTVLVLDINVTTPTATSGVYSIPVSANATQSAWFSAYDCVPLGTGTWCPPITYSLTYWY